MRRLLTFSVKAAISALLLYFSLRQVNLGSVRERLGGFDLRWMSLVLFMLIVQMLFLTLRWRAIVVICGAKLPLATALRYSFIGQFFSQVLPSTVGGDAVRLWLLAPGWGRMATRNLLGADRPRGRRISLGVLGRRLPAMDT
jgi:uncharacterized membrane protein YbhN (UPF0104 family)